MTDEIYLKIQNYIAGLEELRLIAKGLDHKVYMINKDIRKKMEELEEIENEEAEKRYKQLFKKE